MLCPSLLLFIQHFKSPPVGSQSTFPWGWKSLSFFFVITNCHSLLDAFLWVVMRLKNRRQIWTLCIISHNNPFYVSWLQTPVKEKQRIDGDKIAITDQYKESTVMRNSSGQTEGIRCQLRKNAPVVVESFKSISVMHQTSFILHSRTFFSASTWSACIKTQGSPCWSSGFNKQIKTWITVEVSVEPLRQPCVIVWHLKSFSSLQPWIRLCEYHPL